MFASNPDWTPAYAEYYCNESSPYSDDRYGLPVMHSNQVWQDGANASVRCMQQAFWQANWTRLGDWQRYGHDLGTVVRNNTDLNVTWLLEHSKALLSAGG